MVPYIFKYTSSSPTVELIAQPAADIKVFDVLAGENAADELDLVYTVNCN